MSSSSASVALRAVACACRVIAVALCIALVALSFSLGPLRPILFGVQSALASVEPAALRGTLVFPTPMGGAFRGDFAVFALVLFALDRVLSHRAWNIGG